MKKEIIFVGWINKGKTADCGETMKNQLCIKKLEEYGIHCRQIDFKNWKKHPWVIVQLIGNMIIHKDDTLILSTSPKNVYPLIVILKIIKWKQNIVLWVIGGSFGQKVQQKIYRSDVLGLVKHILVESSIMVQQLEACGVNGVIEVPNFKPIHYYPFTDKKYPLNKQPLRFVFLGRIIPEKGCDYILQAARLLNYLGYKDRYKIDFYGKIAENYNEKFYKKVNALCNVNYCGFLDLTNREGYNTLASYDLMLFPTYWKGEGFAGVFIEAFIAGVPIIATDWAHNKIFKKKKKTALFVPVHNVSDLAEKMKNCIDGNVNIHDMSLQCQNEAKKYDINNVITEKLLKRIEVL